MNRALSVFLAFLACGPAAVGAATWHVEQDGSGDWTTIQAAVEASADGDTIRIGPGRYSTLHEAPYSLVVAYWDESKELFFIGAGVDSTIVGPETYTASQTDQYGLNYPGASPQHLHGISFVNLDIGARLGGEGVWVSNCSTVDCKFGISVENANGGRISASEFTMLSDESPWGGVQLRNSRNVVVDSCTFRNIRAYLHSAEADTIRRSTFIGDTHSANASFFASSGVFEHNEVSAGGVYASDGGQVEVRDNVFFENDIAGYNVYVSGRYPVVVLLRNVFSGGFYGTIYLSSYASIIGSDNHILHQEGSFGVRLNSYSGVYDSAIDLRNNYWGTTDPDSIAAWIWDGNDDPTIQQTVQFEPFSAVPLSTEEQSLDSFKSMFK